LNLDGHCGVHVFLYSKNDMSTPKPNIIYINII